jgi:perosamine synthetase
MVVPEVLGGRPAVISHSQPWILEADRRAVDAVLLDGMLAQGRRVEQFEAGVSAYVGASGGVAVASGTAALLLALKGLAIRPGQEVILPTYVCKSVYEAVLAAGGRPVLCDVGEDGNMTPDTVAEKLTPRTAAIIVVHIFGIPADTPAFKKFGLPIIEDACQAFGARLNGVSVGSMGTIGVYSFHAGKCLSTGEGGMAVTQDTVLLQRMRDLRDGQASACGERVVAPMTDLQASLGLSQLARYANFLRRRQAIAKRYLADLAGCPITLPKDLLFKSIFFRFPLRVSDNIDTYRRQFEVRQVQVRRGVDCLLHRAVGLERRAFPRAERLFDTTLSIPIYPAMNEQAVETVTTAALCVFGEVS